MTKQTMLAVLAHPDDESFGIGGTLAYYALQGVEVHLICATRGEVGDVAAEMLEGYHSIAELRETELRCAASILCLTGLHFLDYRDSGMPGSADNTHLQALAAQPLDEVAAKVVHFMRELKPQVVLTFDPIGGYRHPDHIAIHRATVRAFEQSANPAFAPDGLEAYSPQRLYYYVFPKKLLKIGVKILPLLGKNPHKFGTNGDIDISAIANVEFPTNARIDVRSVLEKKEQAGACHASQGGGQTSGGLIAFLMRRFSGSECFMRAYPPVQAGERVSRDLFEPL
jgi:LmbE family N-acetylglucosaminyl deacetylase